MWPILLYLGASLLPLGLILWAIFFYDPPDDPPSGKGMTMEDASNIINIII